MSTNANPIPSLLMSEIYEASIGPASEGTPVLSTSIDVKFGNVTAARSQIIIADVHGQARELAVLLRETIRLHPDADITFLGDLCDRGPDSGGALSLAIVAEHAINRDGSGRTCTVLAGNHDQLLLGAMVARTHDIYSENLIRNGGFWAFENLDGASFHEASKDPTHETGAQMTAQSVTRALSPAARDILDRLPGSLPPIRTWLEARPMIRAVGGLLLVHAGIDPRVTDAVAWANSFPLLPENLDATGPLWIRDRWLDHKGPMADRKHWFVVHGHTIMPAYDKLRKNPDPVDYMKLEMAVLKEHRLAIDAGSFKRSVATACIIAGGRLQVVHAS